MIAEAADAANDAPSGGAARGRIDYGTREGAAR